MSDIFGPGPDDPRDQEYYDRYGMSYDEYSMRQSDATDPTFWDREQTETWWNQGVELQNDSGETYTLSANEWYALTTADPDMVAQEYGMEPLDIIYQLQDDYGMWDSDDWETWRNQYELTAG